MTKVKEQRLAIKPSQKITSEINTKARIKYVIEAFFVAVQEVSEKRICYVQIHDTMHEKTVILWLKFFSAGFYNKKSESHDEVISSIATVFKKPCDFNRKNSTNSLIPNSPNLSVCHFLSLSGQVAHTNK